MDINSEKSWAVNSGLMPLHLNHKDGMSRYIMLDGGIYDFCLDFSDQDDDMDTYKSLAWSSNSKNYIHLKGDDVIVYNWLKNSADKLPKHVVQEKFEQFVKILNSNSYKTSDDVSPFVLELFRKMRNDTTESKEPLEALNLLYCLLVSLEEESFSADVFDKWSISNIAIPGYFDELVSLIKAGRRNINPNLDLMLRHSSGVLFQDAHRVAQSFDRQLSLFGGFTSNIVLKSEELYSSIHYTPQYLARSIVEKCVSNLDLSKPVIRILDPACGSGSFLIEALKQLKEKDYNGRVVLYGWDCSPCAISTTRFLLKYEQRTQWSTQTLEINLKQVSDSLLEDWDDSYDLILMNPPFLSMELLKQQSEKDAVNEALKDLGMKKRPNQSAAFLYKATNALCQGGFLGTIIPSSLLLYEQYIALRKSIREMAELKVVARLGNYVFENALTDVSFVILQKRESNSTPQTIWCRNKDKVAYDALKDWRKMHYNNSLLCIKNDYNIYTPSHFPLVQESWKTIPQSDDLFMDKLEDRLILGNLVELSTVFDIKQGALRGNKDAFIMSSADYDALDVDERILFRPVASAETVHDGKVDFTQYIWYPYDKDGLVVSSEEQLCQYPNVYRWLGQWKESLVKRTGVNYWWALTRPRNWQFVSSPKLISKRFGNSASFALTKGPEVVEEGNAFLLKSKYSADDIYFYFALFVSSIFDRLLSIYAKPLLAGYDLGQVHIKNIPVPNSINCKNTNPEVYQKLIVYGKQYADGNEYVKELIDNLVNQFYPLV